MGIRDNAGFGWPGGWGGGGAGDAFGAATRQYFETMADALRGVSGGARRASNPWEAVFDAWNGAAGGRGAFGEDLDAVVGRFATQGRQWFGHMQSLVERFAGREAAPADIVQAWKTMLGGGTANPFADLFTQMGGRGHAGFDQWFAQAAPLLRSGWADGLFRDSGEWLNLPAFGPAREHQERWQAMARALQGLQEATDGYNHLLLEAGRDAFARFERKLGERSEPGRQLQSARALFDLWVDAAEEAYAEVALSVEFRHRYAALVDAQMRVRAGVQAEVEHMTGLLGMPTRREVDSAHRRIAQLERELRRLQRGAAGARPAVAKRAPAGEPDAGRNAASTSAANEPVAKAPAASKPATGKAAAKKAAARKAPAKKAARKKAASKKAASKKATAGTSATRKTPSKQAPANPAKKKKAAPGKAAAGPTRSAAARATRAPSRRATMAIASAMPLAPEPLPPAPAAGRPSRSPRSADRKR